jgi:zinc/manganese transport system substrate-binding protein
MKILLCFLLLLFCQLSCRAAQEPMKIIALSSILAEIAEATGGDRVQAVSLVKPGVDPHEFEPSPEDMKKITGSDLVLASGKGIEGYLHKLAAAGGQRLVNVGEKIPSLKMDAASSEEDPHWWHSVVHVKQAARVVRDELTRLSPSDSNLFTSNCDLYLRRLDDLEAWIKRKVAELPRNRRKLVTSHDAFQYFAAAYGFTIYPVRGLTHEAERPARELTLLVEEIKKHGVKAVFGEQLASPKVVTEITRETGAKYGGLLHADGLGTGEAGSYEGMMKQNVTIIVEALK